MSPPLRVLLVEDSPTDAKLVVRELKKLGRPLVVECVEEAGPLREHLDRAEWDVVISDWSMPKFSGIEALRLVRGLGHDIPFIIASGTVGEETAVEAMRAGANDYVLKGRLVRLCAVVEREVREHDEKRARRLAEEALTRTQARYARLVDAGIVGIVVGDVTGDVEEINETFSRISGYSADEVRSGAVGWDLMTPPEWSEAERRAIESVATRGFVEPYERELRAKDGRKVPVLVGAAALDFPLCIGFVVDLTELKTAQAALVRSEEQLRQAQKMEAIGRLAGGIAHDFNNLLSVIMSYAALLSAELSEADGLRGDAEEILSAGERASELTRQLLAFSRKQVLSPRRVVANDIIQGVDRMLRRSLGADVELRTVLSPDQAYVEIDPGQMEQILMNLAINARDAMPSGGILTIETDSLVVDVETARDLAGLTPGAHVRIRVTDTGIGMDSATRGQAFEPFFTTKEPGRGTGLGLSTVLGIVQQSGGTIALESEPGHGTTFEIYLPRRDAGDAVDPAPSTSPPATERGTGTILLVEDDGSVRSLARRILERGGYRVLEAETVGDAILIGESGESIDLLLTDVVMPRMSGLALAGRLRESRPALRVLFMSGYAGEEVATLSADTDFLQKPLTPDTLLRKVHRALER